MRKDKAGSGEREKDRPRWRGLLYCDDYRCYGRMAAFGKNVSGCSTTDVTRPDESAEKDDKCFFLCGCVFFFLEGWWRELEGVVVRDGYRQVTISKNALHVRSVPPTLLTKPPDASHWPLHAFSAWVSL